MTEPRAACIIGAAQMTRRPEEGDAPEPLAMWEEMARRAASDTGVAPDRVLAGLESIDVLYCQTWPYDDPAGRLAEALGVVPARRHYSGIGGTTPHLLIDDAAAAIARGEMDLGLVVGGEALDTVRRAKKEDRRLSWSYRDPERKAFPFEAPFHPAEVAHEVFQAWLTFAVFDIARRAHLGVEPEEHRRRLGRMLAPMTEVAAGNPHAWFRTRRCPEDLVEPSPDNRMVGYPYTKYMVAVMDVNMAAGLVLASEEKADALGVPSDRRVYLRGSAYAEDATYVAEHDPMWSSPAMASASRAALEAAGLGIDDVAHLDLYSCFASSLSFACDALGVAPDDSRGLTVTGGLPFAGGPGSGYGLHGTAAMVDVLRADPGSSGLVSGVGMHMTKHSFGIWSTAPPSADAVARLGRGAPTALDRSGAGAHRIPIVETWTGPATVAAYSVVHGRDGQPAWGLAVCDVPDGRRTYARVEDDAALAEALKTEWVGAAIEIDAGADKVNRVRS
ncbi:MAG: acetyl-CoA synthetase [Acidimicrobiales bacterium]